jgi:hypothetical protein
MSEGTITLCQSCMDRGLEPREAIGLYHKLPICDPCLGAIMDNKLAEPDDGIREDPNSLPFRLERAKKVLDKFEEIYAEWPLTAEESMNFHQDFYNHCPPAIVDCSLDQLLVIHSRRKGLLWAMRHKEARWQSDIEIQKQTAREQANLTGMLKSKKEKVKPSALNLEWKKKQAKSMGITVEQLDAMGKESQEREFAKVVETEVKRIPMGMKSGSGAKAELEELKKKVISISPANQGLVENPFTGKWEPRK